MKATIIITTRKGEEEGTHRSKVWEGELDILDDEEYLIMISIMEEGFPHPIVQVPFSKGLGHYIWVPPEQEVIESMGDYMP